MLTALFLHQILISECCTHYRIHISLESSGAAVAASASRLAVCLPKSPWSFSDPGEPVGVGGIVGTGSWSCGRWGDKTETTNLIYFLNSDTYLHSPWTLTFLLLSTPSFPLPSLPSCLRSLPSSLPPSIPLSIIPPFLPPVSLSICNKLPTYSFTMIETPIQTPLNGEFRNYKEQQQWQKPHLNKVATTSIYNTTW